MEIKYQNYTVHVGDTSVMLNGKHLPWNARIILSLNDPVIREKIRLLPEKSASDEYRLTGAEVYESAADLLRRIGVPEDHIAFLSDGMDARTRNYLLAVRKNIGLVEIKTGHDGVGFGREYSLSGWGNLTGSGGIECGKMPSGKWVAEYSFRTDIDDYVVYSVIFDRKPTWEMVKTAKAIEKIELAFLLRRSPVFTCWECGRETHWLDVAAEKRSISDLWEMRGERYCGC